MKFGLYSKAIMMLVSLPSKRRVINKYDDFSKIPTDLLRIIIDNLSKDTEIPNDVDGLTGKKIKTFSDNLEDFFTLSIKNESDKALFVKSKEATLIELNKENQKRLNVKKKIEVNLQKLILKLKSLDKISDEEAIRFYTGTDFAQINSILRGDAKVFGGFSEEYICLDDFLEYINEIQTLKKLTLKNKNSEELYLYRYISLNALKKLLRNIIDDNVFNDEQELCNKLTSTKPTIVDKAFLSTSKSSTATKDFGTVKLNIYIPANTVYLCDIAELSEVPDQEEVLIRSCQKFQVTNAQMNDKQLNINLKGI